VGHEGKDPPGEVGIRLAAARRLGERRREGQLSTALQFAERRRRRLDVQTLT
jgi:hypothetical protein